MSPMIACTTRPMLSLLKAAKTSSRPVCLSLTITQNILNQKESGSLTCGILAHGVTGFVMDADTYVNTEAMSLCDHHTACGCCTGYQQPLQSQKTPIILPDTYNSELHL